MQKQEITTLVCLHDLLGFDNMVSVSGGTFDSAVGKIAHQRINQLRHTVSQAAADFPRGSHLFQLNDQVVAVCDLKYNIGSMLFDESSQDLKVPTRECALQAIQFICAAAKLHQHTIKKEHDTRVGPAGRTFVILGKRWPIDNFFDKVTDFPLLQANLAYFEALAADAAGSKVGFDFRAWDNIYLNDYLWFLLRVAKRSIPQEIQKLSSKLTCNPGTNFPQKLLAANAKSIDTTVFHRQTKFYGIMSHHAVDIATALIAD